MKVPILEKEWLGATREIVHLKIVGKNINFETDAMIDTGSPDTFLSYTDLKAKTRIPYTSYKKEKLVAIGNTKMYMINLGMGKLIFQDKDNKSVSIDHSLLGGIPTNPNSTAVYIIPTILGKDFLDEHSLNIVGKPGRKYLIEYEGD
ncbi:MAG: hypothetical protein ACP5U0_10250 [Caldisphaera sp.]